jgi:prevent-host-death family protein
MRYVAVEEARKQLGRLVREAAAGAPVTISRHGSERAVLLSGEEYERLKRAEEEASKARFSAAIEDIHGAVRDAGLTPDVVDEAIAWARTEMAHTQPDDLKRTRRSQMTLREPPNEPAGDR